MMDNIFKKTISYTLFEILSSGFVLMQYFVGNVYDI